MKISVSHEIDVPNRLVCHNGLRDCDGLYVMRPPDSAQCGVFNEYLFWSSTAQAFVRCRSCLEEHAKFLREN